MINEINRGEKRGLIRRITDSHDLTRRGRVKVTDISDPDTGQAEHLLSVTGPITSGEFKTETGEITIVSVNERGLGELPSQVPSKSIQLVLDEKNILAGKADKKGTIRDVPLGGDGIGAILLGKNNMLWVHVTGKFSGDITPQLTPSRA